MTNRPRSGCAINVAVEVLGDNWSLIVLRDIIFGGRRHFRELLTLNDEGIASNILASRLKKLVDEGLLTKAEAVRGQRAEYSLTEAGVETLPVMVALGTWGFDHQCVQICTRCIYSSSHSSRASSGNNQNLKIPKMSYILILGLVVPAAILVYW